ncbi:hypothetical protein IU486_17280 [Streptomyces gardneri]|uniref:hypothetical protein n=1 Tax=Nocardia TaxID=1817 RepID=UPI001359C139|nr:MULTISPECIES: hypothetical protein [Nocardia]MBF6166496.1 hypothetical protein [Streptomyces gardneri]MBF6205276.1 hypothetical protein [Streptomyces gardneri]UAK31069.1 hypothetical protein K8O92_24910 [Nocardia asteroides]
MLAIAAAVAFGLALIFDLADATFGEAITGGTFVTLGLLLITLHLAGFGTSARAGTGGRSRSWRRVRR